MHVHAAMFLVVSYIVDINVPMGNHKPNCFAKGKCRRDIIMVDHHWT